MTKLIYLVFSEYIYALNIFSFCFGIFMILVSVYLSIHRETGIKKIRSFSDQLSLSARELFVRTFVVIGMIQLSFLLGAFMIVLLGTHFRVHAQDFITLQNAGKTPIKAFDTMCIQLLGVFASLQLLQILGARSPFNATSR